MDIKQQKKSARHAFNKALAQREADSKVICEKIRSSRDLARYDAWNEKRSYGDDTRGLLLASGFVRGLPYKVIEAKVGERNEIGAYEIRTAAEAYAGIMLDGNAIVAWLEGGKPETVFAEPEPTVVPEQPPLRTAPVAEPVKVEEVKPKGFFARLFGAA